MHIMLRLVVAATLAVYPAAVLADEPCPLQWETTPFALRGVDGLVQDAVVFDDGRGPAVYVAGDFGVAGDALASNIARWNGLAWEAVGAGLDGEVRALAVFDDGAGPALYAAGAFTETAAADGQRTELNNIARWDGSRWTALRTNPRGVGLRGEVFALEVFDDGQGPRLYVGGLFERADRRGFESLTRWDGRAWRSLESPPAGRVYAMTTMQHGGQPALFVGGRFDAAGNVDASNIARWDGLHWNALESDGIPGVDRDVWALVAYDDGDGASLYVGGTFDVAGNVYGPRIAEWDGRAWHPLGPGCSGTVFALGVHPAPDGPKLFVGGALLSVGGVAAGRIGIWDGQAWSAPDVGILEEYSGSVKCLVPFDLGQGPRLLVGGDFRVVGGRAPSALAVSNVAVWEDRWSALSTDDAHGLDDEVADLVVFDDGSGPALYAGGAFIGAGATIAHGVARWNGDGWSALDGPTRSGVRGEVNALAVFDDGRGPALYAGGDFVAAGGIGGANLARWDGTAWTTVGGGTNGPIYDLFVHDDGSGPALFVAGDFSRVGSTLAYGLARWDGAGWDRVRGGVSSFGFASALGAFDAGDGAELHVGGSFTSAGGVSTDSIARWNGSIWQTLPPGRGVSGLVDALAVFDDGNGARLYVGGQFTSAGGAPAASIAAWDGAAWETVGPGLAGASGRALVRDMAVSGVAEANSLFMTGSFRGAGNVEAFSIIRWDGTHWHAVGQGSQPGLWGRGSALLEFDDGPGPALFVGGDFIAAGGQAAAHLAILRPCPATCRADIDGDGALTVYDFLAFQGLFQAGDARADFDGDGSLTLMDFVSFQAAFAAGCP